jgi:ActR/RegA family two-component response regulator
MNQLKGQYYSILIVDDDIDQLIILSKILKTQGFSVTTCQSASEGIFLMKKRYFDAIVLDYLLGESTGIEFLEEVRDFNQLVTVILVTGYSSEHLAVTAIRSQCDDLLQKPVDFTSIGSIIRDRIKKRQQFFFISPNLPNQFTKPFPNGFDPFANFIILDNSIPIYSKGQWKNENGNDENSNSENDTLIMLSGFFNAIQSFSNLYLGEPINEMNTKEWKIIFSHAKSILCSIKIPMDIYEHSFSGLHINRIIALLESIVRLINDFHSKTPNKMPNYFDPILKEKIELLFSNAREAFL